MTFAKDDLIEALRLRYDHYSAQSVFDLARERAGLADKPAYEARELRDWRDGLAAVGDRVGRVLDHIDGWLAAAPAKDTKTATPAPKPEPAVKPDPATTKPPPAPAASPEPVATSSAAALAAPEPTTEG